MENVLDGLVKYNNQSNGRDRVFRLFQYTSKLLGWMAEKCKYDKVAINKLKNLEYSLGTARKLLRLGKFVDIMYGALKSIHIPDLLVRVTLTLAKINSAIYYINDNVIWLGRVGLLNINKDKWSTRGNRFWLYSLVLLLIRDIYELYRLINMEMRIRAHCNTSSNIYSSLPVGSGYCLSSHSSNDHLYLPGETVFDAFKPLSIFAYEHKDVVLDTLKNGCDVLIPLTGLGYTSISPGVIGVCGIISSAIGILTILDPMARMQPS